jgi:hypothetical protein
MTQNRAQNRVLTDDEIRRLESLGWKLIQTGPESPDWYKFRDGADKPIAFQGDNVWHYDLAWATYPHPLPAIEKRMRAALGPRYEWAVHTKPLQIAMEQLGYSEFSPRESRHG